MCRDSEKSLMQDAEETARYSSNSEA